MSSKAIVRSCILLLTTAGWLAASPSPAQQAGQGKTGSSDAAAKAKIMASDAWTQMASEYQKWLSTQSIYTPDDLNRINAKLAAQLDAMPASEMQDFLSQWKAKLKVLNGQDFQEAQKWLGEYMSALSDGYRNKTLKELGLTDVASMTADQLEDALIQIRADRLAGERSQAAFNRARQQQVQSIQQANVAGQQAQQQQAADMRAAQINTVQSPYSPAPLYNPAPPMQTPFYVNGSGQVGYMLPF